MNHIDLLTNVLYINSTSLYFAALKDRIFLNEKKTSFNVYIYFKLDWFYINACLINSIIKYKYFHSLQRNEGKKTCMNLHSVINLCVCVHFLRHDQCVQVVVTYYYACLCEFFFLFWLIWSVCVTLQQQNSNL